MTTKEELELILELIGKYNLPLSPILEYAVKEKIEECSAEEHISASSREEGVEADIVVYEKTDNNNYNIDAPSNKLRIVDYGERTIAVVGDTRAHKDALKSIGGYFVSRTQWGSAWVFRDKKREIIQAYITHINGDTSVITREDDVKWGESQKKRTSRCIIRVKYPDGRVFNSERVWETLVDVIMYAGPENVKRLNIICMGDNLVSQRLNKNLIYRSAQKDIGRGLFVCTYSSTDTKYKQITQINIGCKLGLEVEKVYIDESGEKHSDRTEVSSVLGKQQINTRNRTKYSFEGRPFLSKRRFVLEVVKHYVNTHPKISYESLIRVFPSTLNSNTSNGVVKRYRDVLKQVAKNPDIRNRFFLKANEVIKIANGMRVVVHNQWGDDFEKFLHVAEDLYSVKSSNGNSSVSHTASAEWYKDFYH